MTISTKYVVTQKRKVIEFFRFNAKDMDQVIAFAVQCFENGDTGTYRVHLEGRPNSTPVAAFKVTSKGWNQIDRHS